MSSESEGKDGDGHATADIAGSGVGFWQLLCLVLLALLMLSAKGGRGDRVVVSRAVYEELLLGLDVERLSRQSLRDAAAMPAAVAAPPGASCDVPKLHFDFDKRFVPKAQELQAMIGNQPYPSFEQLYELIVNKPYDPMDNIWSTFPNPYHMKPSFAFPFSNLRDTHVEGAIQLLGRRPALMVEVGSFHGHSAILQAKVLDRHGLTETPLLCIDPWSGDLGMLLFRDDWDKKLTPGELADGRSTSYFQFMLNVQSQIEAKQMGPRHIVPLAVTSVVGARYLKALGATPDIIYLDSAHESDETFIELALYYHTLAPGGVVFGDDFSWESVQGDVKRFAAMHNLQVQSDGVTWTLQKPQQR